MPAPTQLPNRIADADKIPIFRCNFTGLLSSRAGTS